jgi:multidrug efflux system membrane fusion protein
MSSGPTLRGKIIAAACICAALVLCFAVLVAIDRRPRTHDARVFAYSAAMAPEINGRIVRILVRNDERVSKGAPLIQMDPVPYEMQLRQARAQVAALKAQIALTGRQVTSQGSGAQAAENQVQKAREVLKNAQDTRRRLEPLVDPGYVTQQQLDDARTNEASALASLNALIKNAAQAHEAVGDTESLQAQLAGAEASEALAARNLDLTTLRAPFDGIVVGLGIAEGTFALSGRPLFSLIKSDAWYAIADFRETELPRIAVGDPATVWTMAESNRPFYGRVESLGAGVESTDQEGPGLPKVGRDLNWVVVAQRFPVWIRLDNPPSDALHVGMTASVKVRHVPAGDVTAAAAPVGTR